MAIKGKGNLVTFGKNGQLYVGRFSAVDFAQEVQTKEVEGYPFDNPDGLLQIVDAFITKETFNVKVSTGSFDKLEMSRIFDQQITKSPSILLPQSQQLVVGVGGAITVTGLIANQQVGVFVPSDTAPKQLTQIVSGSPTVDQFTVTADTVTVAAALIGKTVIVNHIKAYTDIETLGATNAPIGDLGFVGRLIGPRFEIGPLFYIPKMSRFSGFGFGGENSEVTYRATVKSPYAKPIIFAFDVPLPV
jgi:hypothetical protein